MQRCPSPCLYSRKLRERYLQLLGYRNHEGIPLPWANAGFNGITEPSLNTEVWGQVATIIRFLPRSSMMAQLANPSSPTVASKWVLVHVPADSLAI